MPVTLAKLHYASLEKHFSLSWISTDLQIGAACHCHDKSAELEDEAFNLPVGLRSNPYLWSQTLGEEQTNETEDTSFPSSSLQMSTAEPNHPTE